MAKKKKTEDKQHSVITTTYTVIPNSEIVTVGCAGDTLFPPTYVTVNAPYYAPNVTNTAIAVANTEPDSMPPDMREDYENSRSNLQRMMDIGLTAIERMADIADQTQSSKDYRVVGELLTALTGTNSQLLDIQKKLKELQGSTMDKKKGMNVNNAVFFGTTNDLLKLTDDVEHNNK